MEFQQRLMLARPPQGEVESQQRVLCLCALSLQGEVESQQRLMIV